MFPKRYFPKRFFTSRYWPPVGDIVDLVFYPVKIFFRAIVKILYSDKYIEKTFAYEDVLTEFTADVIPITFLDDKADTNIIAKKRILTFYDSKPARR